MKKILLLLLLVSGICRADEIITFADPDFKAFLVAASPNNLVAYTAASILTGDAVVIDTSGDGEIQLSEALLIVRLDLGRAEFVSISDLTGIQSFTNLQSLMVPSFMPMTSFDVSPLVNMRELIIDSSMLETFDVSALVNLETLMLRTGQLSSITLGTLPNLKTLMLDGNDLASINLSGTPNLVSLNFGFNPLTTMPDLSGLTSLKSLQCTNAQLTGLDLTPLVNLEVLKCAGNPLGTLNFSTLPNLITLECYNTGLTTADLSMLTQLQNLNISSNNLTTLNIAPLVNLKTLSCSGISTIDTSPLTQLVELYCLATPNPLNTVVLSPSLKKLTMIGFNQSNFALPLLEELRISDSPIISLDYSGSPKVKRITDSNCENLEYINSKNGFMGWNEAPIVQIFDLPNLQMICAEESVIGNWRAEVSISFNNINPNAQVNSYCSFTPGGAYNTISGNIRFDNDADGCDAGDVVFPNVRINLNDGLMNGSSFNNGLGNYAFFTQGGTFALTPQIENPSYFAITPTSATVNFASDSGEAATANFCATPIGIQPHADISIVPLGQARPGFDARYKVVYKNTGNQTLNGSVAIHFDDARTDFVSSDAGSQTGGSIFLSYANLNPFETRTVIFSINLNSPKESPALNQDDILDFTANLTYSDPFGSVGNTASQLHQTVVNSLDPNDKTCLEGNTISPDMIGNYVHYNINFENIGTAPAQNVVVKDVIDNTKFDIASLQVIYASHPVATRINGNKVEFIFENINLPGTSGDNKGNVLFKIKTKPTLVLGNSISNKAEIFFDYNFPIETNEATSTFAVLKNQDFTFDATIGIYPNPSKGKINVKANSNIRSLQLFDIQGRILQTSTENSKDVSIDISGKQNGIYFLNVTTEKGSKTEKLLKE